MGCESSVECCVQATCELSPCQPQNSRHMLPNLKESLELRSKSILDRYFNSYSSSSPEYDPQLLDLLERAEGWLHSTKKQVVLDPARKKVMITEFKWREEGLDSIEETLDSNRNTLEEGASGPQVLPRESQVLPNESSVLFDDEQLQTTKQNLCLKSIHSLHPKPKAMQIPFQKPVQMETPARNNELQLDQPFTNFLSEMTRAKFLSSTYKHQ